MIRRLRLDPRLGLESARSDGQAGGFWVGFQPASAGPVARFAYDRGMAQCGFAAVLALSLTACGHSPKPTAPSDEPSDASPMELENGEAIAFGTVDYSGDRVDWKRLELPPNQSGALDFTLTWTSPKPGLQLAIDVFDDHEEQIVGSSTRGKRRVRNLKVAKAHGTYFVRVYALDPHDAGKYRLGATFKPVIAATPPPPPTAPPTTPTPPVPPAPPNNPPPPVAACEVFDVKDRTCKNVCPKPPELAPPGWPPCKDVCPTVPSADIEACLISMPCPPGKPERRIKACKPIHWPACPDPHNPDRTNPNCPSAPAPYVLRIIGTEVKGDDLIVRVAIGRTTGVKMNWSAVLTRRNVRVPGGDGTIVVINPTDTRIRFNGSLHNQLANDSDDWAVSLTAVR